jgi:uncharacterized membrane protein YkvA (DUF1232 family)
MAFARTFSRFRTRTMAREETYVRRGFWDKLRHVAALIPFAEDLLAAWYCAVDRTTPNHVKIALFGALAYFIMPFDAVPDIVPALGFADDAAMLAAALRLVSGHITPGHREKAQRALTQVMNFTRR